jgi:hypothetical protein
MERLGEILVDLRFPVEEVNKITRWDRTWLIEKAASSKLGPTLLGGSIAKFARPATGPATATGNDLPSIIPVVSTGDKYRDELIARKNVRLLALQRARD